MSFSWVSHGQPVSALISDAQVTFPLRSSCMV